MDKLYSAIYGDDYPFRSLAGGRDVQAVIHPADMLSFDSALIIWGGSDISPELYKHPMSSRCAPYAGRRDQVEWTLLHEAINMDIPIIGVCRGAQMLCAAAGGFLIQDVNGHAGPSHKVKTYDGKEFKTNSLHHQMMVPYGTEHELIAWSETNVGASYIYRDDKLFKPIEYGYNDTDNVWREPEFIYFPKINGYAIQWHPEMMNEDCEATKYILEFIKDREAKRTRVVKFEQVNE